MSILLTPEQSQQLHDGQAVHVRNPDTGEDIVVLRGSEYETIRELLEEEQARRAIANASLKSAAQWARENPY